MVVDEVRDRTRTCKARTETEQVPANGGDVHG